MNETEKKKQSGRISVCSWGGLFCSFIFVFLLGFFFLFFCFFIDSRGESTFPWKPLHEADCCWNIYSKFIPASSYLILHQ